MTYAIEKLNYIFCSTGKLASELDDATHELDTHRAKVLDLEKKQRNFDKILAEEKLNADRIASERDTAESLARDKETKLLNLNRELDETMVRLEESERSKKQLQNELEEVVNSQVSIYFPSLDFEKAINWFLNNLYFIYFLEGEREKKFFIY